MTGRMAVVQNFQMESMPRGDGAPILFRHASHAQTECVGISLQPSAFELQPFHTSAFSLQPSAFEFQPFHTSDFSIQPSAFLIVLSRPA
jgi:hypothetical protein